MKTFTLLFYLSLVASVAFAQPEQVGQSTVEMQQSGGVIQVAEVIEVGVAADNDIRQGPESVPDLRAEDLKLKLQKRDFVIVPIPVSNPTFNTGLVLGGAYFYPQTEEQKKVQPPSVTGAVGFKSSNKSEAFVLAHQSYLDGNKWRIGGAIGYADLVFDLRVAGQQGERPTIKWIVQGEFLATKVTRKIAGKWYAGGLARYLKMDQSFAFDAPVSDDFDTSTEATSAGLGFTVEHDNRDRPLNSYSGHIFEVDVVFNGSAFGSDDSYQSYGLKYRSYHSLTPSLVLAWETQACARSDRAPLWDACRISLRGFSATDYMGKTSASAQAEARWRFHRKWGAVAFAGGGYVNNPFSDPDDRDLIPSYGVGLRFLVLESQRINIRLDYARSKDSDAIYFSVGEAF